jgi:hypothetical protein
MDLGLHMLGLPRPEPLPGEIPAHSMNVPRCLAEFFIEALAEDAPEIRRHRGRKEYRSPVILRIRLPDPIPMLVSTHDDAKIQFGFFDTETEMADALERRVSVALNQLAGRSLFIADFRSVDIQNFPDEAIPAIAREFKLPLLRLERGIDRENELKSFIVKILEVEWGDVLAAKVRAALQEAFERGKVCTCKVCGLMFSPLDHGGCEEAYHRGQRLRFPSGAIQEDDIEGGDRVTYINTSCCGRVLLGTSCAVRIHPEHVPDPQNPVSELILVERPLYPPPEEYQ